ncbi:MAG: hypothetical protein ACREHG_04030, partial [Candidatus Saccharimonadales bacterium]
DGLTAKNIYANGAALIGGELSTTVPALVKYDGTQFNLLNPQPASGSFTITLTGMSATTTGTIYWQISNGIVDVWLRAAISGTSNATTMTGTGIPAALSAANVNAVLCPVIDSGTFASGFVRGMTSTTWTFEMGSPLSATGFTNTGTKGLGIGQVFSYPLK